jgi:L-ascorbate metabolism protein UlaG (beta-lactamase superfamily)
LSTGSSLPFLRNLLSLSLDQYTLTSSLHCSPADSLEIHRILGSKNTVGIHWGTFCDQHEARGTRVEFGRARRQRGVEGRWRGTKLVDGLEIPGTDAEEGSSKGTSVGEREVEHGGNGGNGRFVICDIGETLVLPE